MRRREFMAGGTALAAAALDGVSPRIAVGRDEEREPAAIDSHVHFFAPPADDRPTAGDARSRPAALPADWQRVAHPCNVTQAVVIEASPDVEDNQRLLDLAERHPWIVGVIGRLPIGTQGCGRLIDRFAAHRRFRGIRLRSDVLLAGLDEPAFAADLEHIAAERLVVDVIGPTQFEAVERLAARLPRLSMLLEHMGGAMISGDGPDPRWLEGLARAARLPNTFLKVSHVIQSKDRDREAPGLDRYEPWLAAVWNAFGGQRVMFGSDWPVSGRHATYARIHDLVRQFVAGRGAETSRAFFTDNARHAYGLVDAG